MQPNTREVHKFIPSSVDFLMSERNAGFSDVSEPEGARTIRFDPGEQVNDYFRLRPIVVQAETVCM